MDSNYTDPRNRSAAAGVIQAMYTQQQPSGILLTKTEANQVENTLVHLILAQGNDGQALLTMDPVDFMRKLGWSQFRHPDVRDHLESWPTRERIAKRIGKSLENIYMSRTLLSVNAGTPRQNRNGTVAALSAVLDITFDMARKWMDPDEMRDWVNERLDMLFR